MSQPKEAFTKNGEKYVVFGQPVEGVRTLLVDSKPIRFEIARGEITGLKKSIQEVIEEDKVKRGATWDKFGGIVFDVEYLPLTIAAGLVSEKDFDKAVVANDGSSVTVEAGAKQLYEIFEPGWDKLILDNHPYYQRKMTFMTSEGMEKKFGGKYAFVTVDRQGNVL